MLGLCIYVVWSAMVGFFLFRTVVAMTGDCCLSCLVKMDAEYQIKEGVVVRMCNMLYAGCLGWDAKMEVESNANWTGVTRLGAVSSTLPLQKPKGLHSSDRAAGAVGSRY